MTTAEKLVSLRKEKGLSQLQLAEEINVSRQAISRWEVGLAVPSREKLRALSELYNVSVDYLLSDKTAEDMQKVSKPEDEAKEKFGFMVNALQYGTPPHAGLAYGLDRLVMLMAKQDSIRDVIAFPKIKDASCLMTQAPQRVSEAQLDELGLEAPDTMEEAVEIVRAFVEQDPGNNGEGNTIGLVCHSDLTGETGYRYEFQLNTLFASYSAFPKQWILQEDGTVVYGSVQPQVKEALAEVRKLYEEKLLDDSFMLRTMANIAELIVDGKCGSFFGPWWAPNNPLMEAMEKNPDAVWEPYLIRTTEDGKLQYYDQNPSYKYVVVRKDFEHPEIVFKMASVMFDKMRTEGRYNEELAYYFQTNVDSTARPISINIDYSDALHRCYEDINGALTGKKDPDELQVLEYAYYEKCKDYLENSQSADAETWAAYESRIRACALLDNKDLEVCSTVFSGETETMKTKWSKLQEMEKKLYLEIITGVKELDEFDRFVEEWMEAGGEQITLEVTEAVREAKGA